MKSLDYDDVRSLVRLLERPGNYAYDGERDDAEEVRRLVGLLTEGDRPAWSSLAAIRLLDYHPGGWLTAREPIAGVTQETKPEFGYGPHFVCETMTPGAARAVAFGLGGVLVSDLVDLARRANLALIPLPPAPCTCIHRQDQHGEIGHPGWCRLCPCARYDAEEPQRSASSERLRRHRRATEIGLPDALDPLGGSEFLERCPEILDEDEEVAAPLGGLVGSDLVAPPDSTGLHSAGQAAVCQRPPAGWICSREAGHGGPCAAMAVPAEPDELERYGSPTHYVIDDIDGAHVSHMLTKLAALRLAFRLNDRLHAPTCGCPLPGCRARYHVVPLGPVAGEGGR